MAKSLPLVLERNRRNEMGMPNHKHQVSFYQGAKLSNFGGVFYLGGSFKYFLFSPGMFGEMIQFDEHIFQMD